MRCHCDGRYEGCEHDDRCEREGGSHRSPYFCIECDPRRIETISRQLDDIRASFDGK